MKITTETTSLEEDTEGIEKYNIYKSMIGDMTVEQYEEEMKRQFGSKRVIRTRQPAVNN